MAGLIVSGVTSRLAFPGIPECTWSELVATPISYDIGRIVFVSDVGVNGSLWRSNGVTREPVGGEFSLNSSTIASGVPSSGTINTGSSGTLTLTTALHRIYAAGIWLWLPAIATTPAITAGLYWIVMSSTTVGTIYSNGPGSAALTITGGLGYTQTTGSDLTLKTIPVLGGVLGSNGQMTCDITALYPNSAGAKTVRGKFGATTFCQGAPTTTVVQRILWGFKNSNSETSQEGLQFLSSAGGTGTGTTLPPTGTDNTASDANLIITGQLATATDYVIVSRFLARLIR